MPEQRAAPDGLAPATEPQFDGRAMIRIAGIVVVVLVLVVPNGGRTCIS
jgi:hypothetical protein